MNAMGETIRSWALAGLSTLVLGCSPEQAVAPTQEPETPSVAAEMSCAPTEGTSPADLNVPFEASISPTGHVARFHVPAMTCEGCAWQIRELALGMTDLGGARAGQAMGLNVFTLFLGLGIGSLLFGALLPHGFGTALLVFAVAQLLLAVLGVPAFRDEIRRAAVK